MADLFDLAWRARGVAKNCGTGAGGFKPGNDCAAGSGGGSGGSGKKRRKKKKKPGGGSGSTPQEPVWSGMDEAEYRRRRPDAVDLEEDPSTREEDLVYENAYEQPKPIADAEPIGPNEPGREDPEIAERQEWTPKETPPPPPVANAQADQDWRNPNPGDENAQSMSEAQEVSDRYQERYGADPPLDPNDPNPGDENAQGGDFNHLGNRYEGYERDWMADQKKKNPWFSMSEGDYSEMIGGMSDEEFATHQEDEDGWARLSQAMTPEDGDEPLVSVEAGPIDRRQAQQAITAAGLMNQGVDESEAWDRAGSMVGEGSPPPPPVANAQADQDWRNPNPGDGNAQSMSEAQEISDRYQERYGVDPPLDPNDPNPGDGNAQSMSEAQEISDRYQERYGVDPPLDPNDPNPGDGNAQSMSEAQEISDRYQERYGVDPPLDPNDPNPGDGNAQSMSEAQEVSDRYQERQQPLDRESLGKRVSDMGSREFGEYSRSDEGRKAIEQAITPDGHDQPLLVISESGLSGDDREYVRELMDATSMMNEGVEEVEALDLAAEQAEHRRRARQAVLDAISRRSRRWSRAQGGRAMRPSRW